MTYHRPSETVIAAVTAALNGDQMLVNSLLAGRPLDGSPRSEPYGFDDVCDMVAVSANAVHLVVQLLEILAEDADTDPQSIWLELLHGYQHDAT